MKLLKILCNIALPLSKPEAVGYIFHNLNLERQGDNEDFRENFAECFCKIKLRK